jgi:dynein heavy chain
MSYLPTCPPTAALPQEYLDKYEEIPFRVLRFLFTEINYGGRVTDDKDRRLINNLVHTFCGPQVLEPRYR